MGSGLGTLAVSFHGSTTSGVRNIRAFPTGGGPFPLLGSGPQTLVMPELRELRAFVVGPDDALYVADGTSGSGAVLRFVSSGGQPPWAFHNVFATAGVSHPFDLCFWSDGTLFVSNQNSNSVTSYDASGSPGPTCIQDLKKVRGLATDGTRLYVAEAGRGVVKAYDRSGKHLGDVVEVPEPVHLLYGADGWLWIGSESANAVYAYDPTRPSAGASAVVHGDDTGIDHTAGLCLLDGDAVSSTLLVASRVSQQVLAFPLQRHRDGTPRWSPATHTVVLDKEALTDNPEFVALAPPG
jgi:outer membrane protein assembly factor BamB